MRRFGFVLRLAPGARLHVSRNAVWVAAGGRRLRVDAVPRSLVAVFRRLAAPGGTEPELAALARSVSGLAGLARWRAGLSRLEEGCAVCYEVRDGRTPLARLVPMANSYLAIMRSAKSGRRTLSRFACLRRREGVLVVESPLAYARVEMEPPAIPLLAPLTSDRAGRGSGRPNGVSERTAKAFVTLLDAAGLLTAVGPGGRTSEDRDPDLKTWEFADLLFHARSRLGRHDAPVGATFEHRGRLPAPPAVKNAKSRGAIALERPDLAPLEDSDPSFTRVLERRRSVRRLGRRPLTRAQLGEFLFRTARVRRWRRATTRVPYETTSRPYPSGGACYPLEMYLAVSRCTGLPRGLYHYDPLGHRLEPVPGGRAQVGPLVRDTRRSFRSGAPPVLIMITARFSRVSWKYRSMAYSVVLKDVGVLMQTMYLVATAMGLAPCAVGCGDAERSARALGTRFETESSVGEFLLGTLPGGPRASR